MTRSGTCTHWITRACQWHGVNDIGLGTAGQLVRYPAAGLSSRPLSSNANQDATNVLVAQYELTITLTFTKLLQSIFNRALHSD